MVCQYIYTFSLTFYTAYRYREKKAYQRFSRVYRQFSYPPLRLVLDQSYAAIRKFTFYHCRMAMFVVLLLPGQSKYRQYFALLGTFGTLAAFVYPVPDAYPFPHIAILSFIFGHLALLGNSLVYLLRQYNARLLDVKGIFLMTFALNALIFCGQFGNWWRLRILDKTAIGWRSRLSS